jgi:hypothetical protein
MPGFNQTGPMEQGSMTGRKKGGCTNYGASLRNQNDSASIEKGEDQSGNLPGKGPGPGKGRGLGTRKGRGLGPGKGRGLGPGKGRGLGAGKGRGSKGPGQGRQNRSGSGS